MFTNLIPSGMVNNVNSSNFNNSSMSSKKNNGEDKPKKYRAHDMWYHLNKARVTFNRQFAKTSDLKWKIMDNEFSRSIDREKMLCDYVKQVKRLTDSRRFESDAEKRGFIPIYVATHIVFLGKTAVNDVLENGLESIINEKSNLFRECLLPSDVQEFFGLTLKKEGEELS